MRNFHLPGAVLLSAALLGCQVTPLMRQLGIQGTSPSPTGAAAVAPQGTPASPLSWNPNRPFAALQREDLSAIQEQQGFLLSGELFRALGAYYIIHRMFPTSLQELLDANLLFHLPLTSDGSQRVLVQVAAGEEPALNQVGYRFNHDSVDFIMPITGESTARSWRRTVEFGPFVTGYANARPRRPVQELASAYFSGGGPQHATPDPSQLPHLANKYLFNSDQMNELRLLKFHSTVKLMVLDYVRVHGCMPDSWDQVLGTFRLQPRNYSPVSNRTLMSAGGAAMMYQAEVASDAALLRCYLKPTLPAFDRFVFEYRRDWAVSKVTMSEDAAQSLPGTFRPILITQLPTDPLPKPDWSKATTSEAITD